MITVMNHVKKPTNEAEKCLDPQLWHACAGGMVQMPPLNSTVLYFPQGHAEHSGIHKMDTRVDLSVSSRIPAYIMCQVSVIKFMADIDTDEVYARIALAPVKNPSISFDFDDDEDEVRFDRNENKERPSSFAKTLTQSDANNGGGFSVPRYCAETIFPRLDYTAEPPVQIIMVKDVHGQMWKFRHIYRGTPRRHLLTTGWSNFVNHKKLVAGDSVVFLRADNGDLCVGIRRAKRGIGGGFHELPTASSLYGGGLGLARFRPEHENGENKTSVEAVVEATNLAASGQPFEVVYYPRASTPEFCVKASIVKAAMRIQWCPGMRFKMAFETEDSSRISWFMGTISKVQVDDQIHWPNSPWRLLEVAWDEPELLQNVKRVNPWLVELVPSMPVIHLAPFSPPRKKLRFPQPPDFPLLTVPPSIQGARHSSQFVLDHNFRFNPMHPFPHGFTGGHSPLSLFPFQERDANVSCLLTIGNQNPNPSLKKKKDETNVKEKEKPLFVLFGQPILTEQQLTNRISCNTNDSSDGSSEEDDPWVETGHCKVFMESDDVGRTFDLTALGSYEELYIALASMFGLEKLDTSTNLIYRNADGIVKHTGDEPFSEFMKEARKLTILRDSVSRKAGC
ncbi:putative transcription factor ARF family [Helianthus debilis subsp. tardiflorus]